VERPGRLFYRSLAQYWHHYIASGSTYGPDGKRISLTDSSGIRNFFYDGNDVIQEYDSNWSTVNTEYTHGCPRHSDSYLQPLPEWVGSHVPSSPPTQAEAYSWPRVRERRLSAYLMKDRLGSIINIMDASENLKTTYSYDAFGQPTATYHSDQVDCMYRFTGRVYDGEMGDYFYRARYYNQSLGRFFSRDPIFSLSSLYAYCHNSPTNFTDPTGMRIYDDGLEFVPGRQGGRLPCSNSSEDETEETEQNSKTSDDYTYEYSHTDSQGCEWYKVYDSDGNFVGYEGRKEVVVTGSSGGGGGDLVYIGGGDGSSGYISDGWWSIYCAEVAFVCGLFGYTYRDLFLYPGLCFVSGSFFAGLGIGFTIRNDQSMLDMIPGGFNSEDIARAKAIANFNERRRMKELGSISVNVGN